MVGFSIYRTGTTCLACFNDVSIPTSQSQKVPNQYLQLAGHSLLVTYVAVMRQIAGFASSHSLVGDTHRLAFGEAFDSRFTKLAAHA